MVEPDVGAVAADVTVAWVVVVAAAVAAIVVAFASAVDVAVDVAVVVVVVGVIEFEVVVVLDPLLGNTNPG